MRSQFFATVRIALLSTAMLLPGTSPPEGIGSGARAAPPPVSPVTPGSSAEYPDSLVGSTFAHSPSPRPQQLDLAQLPSAQASASSQWAIQCVDCPKQFSRMTDRSLRLDAAGHPHIAYGEDHLYYAWHDGTSWHYETVDDSPGVGQYASLALDAHGHPHISYAGGPGCEETTVKYARWTGSAWSIQTVDSEGRVGEYTSLALDAEGYPHISYCDETNYDLKYACWTGSSWTVDIVDASGGGYTSLALDADGRPHISYGNGDLRYARWTGSAWSIETVDTRPAAYTSLALDADLKYARWTGSAWGIQIVDSEGCVAEYTSLALDADGHPHIGYYDSYCDWYNHDLKYARWTGSAWSIETVDSAGTVGAYTSLALDANDNAHISYYELYNHPHGDDLKYARWTGSSWSIETVDGGFWQPGDASLALDGDGHPHIAYDAYELGLPWTIFTLKYARWTGSAWGIERLDGGPAAGGAFPSLALDADGHPRISYCGSPEGDWNPLRYADWDGSAWNIETVDGVRAAYTSLALDACGNPHVSYQDGDNDALKYARWTGSAWSIETVDSAGWEDTSLALDGDGHPHISYCAPWPHAVLKYARWDGSAWSIDTVDGVLAAHTSLALDRHGHAHISYYDWTNADLKYARWTGSAWSIETVDGGGHVGAYNSLALDAQGHPRISYYDQTNGDLKYAHVVARPFLPLILNSV